MLGVALAARLLLGAVFLIAAVAKLFDRPGSLRALREFGVPDAVARVGAISLPIIELTLVAGLLVPATAWWALLGALVLVSLFATGIAISLYQGRAPDCHCFGQWHSKPAGIPTLARNGALAAIAVVALVRGTGASQLSPVAWVAKLGAADLVLVCVVAGLAAVVSVQGWFMLELFRQRGRMLLRLEALETDRGRGVPARMPAPGPLNGHPRPSGAQVGKRATAFELPSVGGGSRTLQSMVDRGRPVLLIFSDPQCEPCESLLPEISGWQHEHAHRLTVAVISRGTMEANEALARTHALTDVLVQSNREVAEAFDVLGTPGAVLMAVGGRIAMPPALGADAIRHLVITAATSGPGTDPKVDVVRVAGATDRLPDPGPPLSLPARLQVGDLVPELTWHDLDGRSLSLSSFRGSETTLVFWNPRCGFCERLLADLQSWERENHDRLGHLVLISSGTEGENRALGLHCPIVSEPDFRTGRSFGARGTPSAVRIGADGRVVTPIAVGGPATLELLGGEVLV